jgi:TolB protein
MTRPGTGYRSSALLFCACATVACGGDDGVSDPADTGSIQVTATTTGDDLDADGYTVAMDGGASRNIGSNGSTTWTSVAAGQHQVTLSGLAANCAVTGDNPATASVTGGATASVSFQVVCTAPTAFIQVSTNTSGDDLDPDGYTAVLDGGAERSIGLNGVTTFSDVSVGQHQVELTGIADNCSVSGANPAGASVTAGATAAVSFTVECEALPIGSLEVTTSVTNNFDPDGYQVFAAGSLVGRVDVNGTANFDEVPAGVQDVELREIAPNCAVDGDNPISVDIPVGGAATYGFSVTCTNPPDGRIVYLSWNSSTGNSGFSVVNADGTGDFVLRHWGPEYWPRRAIWSPDGTRLAVIHDVEDPGNWDLYVMNQDGTNLTRLTNSPETEDRPTWSPDGTRIAFSRAGGHVWDAEIFVVNTDGSDLQQLTDDPLLSSGYPSWSPDGSSIVFWRTDNPGNMNADDHISVMSADGTGIARINEPAPICDQGFNEGFPAWSDFGVDWSPDGSRIAFYRRFTCEPEDATNGYDVMTMNPDGTGVTNLTDGPGWEADPHWSPDGSKIVFEGGENDIYVMHADGTGVVQLPATGVSADWGP